MIEERIKKWNEIFDFWKIICPSLVADMKPDRFKVTNSEEIHTMQQVCMLKLYCNICHDNNNNRYGARHMSQIYSRYAHMFLEAKLCPHLLPISVILYQDMYHYPPNIEDWINLKQGKITEDELWNMYSKK